MTRRIFKKIDIYAQVILDALLQFDKYLSVSRPFIGLLVDLFIMYILIFCRCGWMH